MAEFIPSSDLSARDRFWAVRLHNLVGKERVTIWHSNKDFSSDVRIVSVTNDGAVEYESRPETITNQLTGAKSTRVCTGEIHVADVISLLKEVVTPSAS
ncbi:MAG: hypothetical protein V1664_04795 [Candidatus Uhrbacteria bacterium]